MQDTNRSVGTQSQGEREMIKSVLVAIDESKAGRSALELAVHLSKITDAKLKGLHVENILRLLEWQPVELMSATIGFSSGIPGNKPTEEQIEIEKKFLEENNKLKNLFQEEVYKHKVNGIFLIKRGKVEEEITNVARTADITIIGRSHMEGSQDVGLTTEYLLRHTTRPVFVVPEKGKVASPVVIGYDGSLNAQRALSAGAQFAALLKAHIKVVSVADDINSTEAHLDEAKEFLDPYSLRVEYIVDFGYSKPWKAILEQVKNYQAGLIVIGAFGENKFLEMIFGSTTKEILKQATCPVLLAR